MKPLKLTRKAIADNQENVNSLTVSTLVTQAELERFAPVLAKVAKKLAKR